jgi:hypothetical protein
MILSSRISLESANKGKQDKIALFIHDYRQAMDLYVDYLWTKCNIADQKYKISFIATVLIN